MIIDAQYEDKIVKQSNIIDMSTNGITFQIMFNAATRDLDNINVHSVLTFVKLTKKQNHVHSNKYIWMSCHDVIGNDEIKGSTIDYKSIMTNALYNEEIKADDKWHLFIRSNYKAGTYSRYIIKLEFIVKPLEMSFSAIHDDNEFTDFVLRSTDGSVHMHKAVAAAISPYFKTLFTGEWSETSEGEVEVPNTSLVTLQYLKDYMYTGKMPKSGDLKELLLLSSMYMMQDLEMRCVEEMTMQVNAESAYDLLKFAITNNMSRLSLRILELIQNGFLMVEDIKSFVNEQM